MIVTIWLLSYEHSVNRWIKFLFSTTMMITASTIDEIWYSRVFLHDVYVKMPIHFLLYVNRLPWSNLPDLWVFVVRCSVLRFASRSYLHYCPFSYYLWFFQDRVECIIKSQLLLIFDPLRYVWLFKRYSHFLRSKCSQWPNSQVRDVL